MQAQDRWRDANGAFGSQAVALVEDDQPLERSTREAVVEVVEEPAAEAPVVEAAEVVEEPAAEAAEAAETTETTTTEENN